VSGLKWYLGYNHNQVLRQISSAPGPEHVGWYYYTAPNFRWCGSSWLWYSM